MDHVKFDRGHVKPSLVASLASHILRRTSKTFSIEVNGKYLNRRINLMNFAGLFSGKAVALPRRYGLRLTVEL